MYNHKKVIVFKIFNYNIQYCVYLNLSLIRDLHCTWVANHTPLGLIGMSSHYLCMRFCRDLAHGVNMTLSRSFVTFCCPLINTPRRLAHKRLWFQRLARFSRGPTPWCCITRRFTIAPWPIWNIICSNKVTLSCPLSICASSIYATQYNQSTIFRWIYVARFSFCTTTCHIWK